MATDKKHDITAGIQSFSIDHNKLRLTLELVVASTKPGIHQYKEVYDLVETILKEKGYWPVNDQETETGR